MNSVHGFFMSMPHMESNQPLTSNVGKKSTQAFVSFQELLTGQFQMGQTTEQTELEAAETIDETLLESLQAFIQLHDNIVDNNEMLQFIMEHFSIDLPVAQQLLATMESTNNEADVMKSNINVNYIESFIQVEKLTEESIQQLQLFVNDTKTALNDVHSQHESLRQLSSRILALLEQWSKLSGEEKNTVTKLLNDEVTEEEQLIWKRLVTIFDKRDQYSEYGNYRTQAKVSRTDVMNWLQQFSHQFVQGQEHSSIATYDMARSMTEVEQYVLHIQSTNKVERINNEFMQKFVSIINQSKFGKLDNDITQLSIVIRTENLGNITLRFLQIDGEMFVKIIVSSQMAKDLLESNTHQLKHLFAPHQVIIERDESISDEQFFNEDNLEEELQEDDSTNETKEDNESQNENEPEIDFESLLATVGGGINDE